MQVQRKKIGGESGAALVTVLFISVLLVTASVAMLTATGANSKNTTDVLSETKAYYAAETGIQAAVNVLRNTSPMVTYSAAANNPSLSNWLTYSGGQVGIGTGTGTGYSLSVTNPDANAVAYNTGAKFLSVSGCPNCVSGDGRTVTVPDPAAFPGATPRFELTVSEVSSTSPTLPNTLVGTFALAKVPDPNNPSANPPKIPDTTFRIDYRLSSPRFGVASIYGTLTQANASSPAVLSFQSHDYKLLGSTLTLCNVSGSCGLQSFNLGIDSPPLQVLVNATPAFSPEPYRLKIVSTGYGPAGAVKQLEAIVRRNFFDGFDPPGTMLLIGPNNDGVNTFHYASGNSHGTGYSGGTCTSQCVPAFAATDQNNIIQIINQNSSNSVYVNPAPQLVEFANLPPWLRTPADLETLLAQLRITAQHSSRYFTLGGGNIPNFPASSIANATGVTFCEGSCKLNSDGGGILVVTGALTYKGSVNYKGLIIVTGQGGWNRDGGGGSDNGQVAASIIIAPYNRSPYTYPYPSGQMSSTFLAPWYDMGGGGSNILAWSDINSIFDNTSAVSDIVAGVAEK
jgi:Tfp pilus assembly protein PilX